MKLIHKLNYYKKEEELESITKKLYKQTKETQKKIIIKILLLLAPTLLSIFPLFMIFQQTSLAVAFISIIATSSIIITSFREQNPKNEIEDIMENDDFKKMMELLEKEIKVEPQLKKENKPNNFKVLRKSSYYNEVYLDKEIQEVYFNIDEWNLSDDLPTLDISTEEWNYYFNFIFTWLKKENRAYDFRNTIMSHLGHIYARAMSEKKAHITLKDIMNYYKEELNKNKKDELAKELIINLEKQNKQRNLIILENHKKTRY